ncbi:response regulator [Shewanella vaxholmensis]|uniref:response regulator n=1 Tax=Shewanella vaxholmensis TaxID=3063535 RepID=UPI00288E9F41|nr:response regulator [Shewanella sp. SP1S1-4]MDT3309487.1 response regulator [Shewanella sp. SP1S1-4]
MHYTFRTFMLDVQNRTLHYNSERINCDERVILLISLLIEAYPEHCDQAFLLEKIWPNTVVSSWSVARLISDTRKLFTSAGLDIPIIQTLHGRGYRLSHDIAAILSSQNDEVQPAAPQNTDTPTVNLDSSKTQQSDSNQQQSPNQTQPSYKRVNLRYLWLFIASVAITLAVASHQQTQRANPLVLAEPNNVKARILWVDDHPENNQTERQYLEERQIGVYTTQTTQDALTLLGLYRYDAIITDMGREADPLAGLKMIRMIRELGIPTPIYLYTIMPSEALRQKAREHGANDIAVEAEDLYQHLTPLIDSFDLESSPH